MVTRREYIADHEDCRRHIVEQLEPLMSGDGRLHENHFGQTLFDSSKIRIEQLKFDLAEENSILEQLNREVW